MPNHRVKGYANRRPQHSGRFRLRAQLRGTLRWTCPDCGYLNRDTMAPGKFLLTCLNDGGTSDPSTRCGSIFVGPGIVLYRPKTGPKELPPDTIVPDSGGLVEPMPEGSLDPQPWWSGDPIHQVK